MMDRGMTQQQLRDISGVNTVCLLMSVFMILDKYYNKTALPIVLKKPPTKKEEAKANTPTKPSKDDTLQPPGVKRSVSHSKEEDQTN